MVNNECRLLLGVFEKVFERRGENVFEFFDSATLQQQGTFSSKASISSVVPKQFRKLYPFFRSF